MSAALDFIQRFLFEQHNIRGEIVSLHDSYQTIIEKQKYPAVIRELVGQLLAATVLLAETIKFKGQLTIQLDGDGPVTLLVAKCDHQRHVRALAQWDKQVEPINIHSALGQGRLVLTLEYDDKVKPYQSIIELKGQSIPAAIADYFKYSEQLETRLLLASDAHSAAGIMLQRMPGQVDAEVWNELEILLNTLTKDELLELSSADILRRLYHEYDIRLYDHETIAFQCRCSISRMERAVKTLGEKDAMDILKSSREIVVTCDYCQHEYSFDKNQVLDIFARKD
jgi:molecular chaperone Hsp33